MITPLQQLGDRPGGYNFGRQTVAITGVGSYLAKVVVSEGWFERFLIWD